MGVGTVSVAHNRYRLITDDSKVQSSVSCVLWQTTSRALFHAQTITFPSLWQLSMIK